ncbi:low affinity immunoglobulin epsilon Fc receptor [Elysia marginata]|uniref:Low affinity immunoglobulin epsilon Fc receptor n=1 Tax=Elysia marginata TaxID=1093978 RepID=A0AAV4G3X3_9GAST|nr:low affinity immunoglobulin epsilon Fc receptor [Elysia marginata]
MLSIRRQIENASVNDFILELLEPFESFWIGLTDRAHPGKFRWHNELETAPYQNWAPGEPSMGHCALVNFNSKWITDFCLFHNSFVCEKYAGKQKLK